MFKKFAALAIVAGLAVGINCKAVDHSSNSNFSVKLSNFVHLNPTEQQTFIFANMKSIIEYFSSLSKIMNITCEQNFHTPKVRRSESVVLPEITKRSSFKYSIEDELTLDLLPPEDGSINTN